MLNRGEKMNSFESDCDCKECHHNCPKCNKKCGV